MNILLIEDEQLIQKSLKKLLELRGAYVVAVSTGNDAVVKLKEFKFDRIICDLMLNDITGFEIIEEAIAVYGRDCISQLFIIITAYSSAQTLDTASQYGCKILSKPFHDINIAIDEFMSISNEELNEEL